MPESSFYEKQFYTALQDIFIGVKVEGKSGFINLMQIKSRYYTQGVFPRLKTDIEAVLKQYPDFREELFDKLYSFFKEYFSESGSIYFRYTPLHKKIYEKVYTDERDVILFWKTHMLYYVKTDRIFTSLTVPLDGMNFYFDASQVEHKRANEKRELVFILSEVRPDQNLVFLVSYSERGSKTKEDEILRQARQAGVDLDAETLQRALRAFEKQSEVDYFINKDARSFLQEQFELWLYQYLFAGQNIWSAERLARLQSLKDIAYKVIDFISQFEDELVKVWNKPKFALNSHYILTLDYLLPHPSLLDRLFAHPGMVAQLDEWRRLGMLEAGQFADLQALYRVLHERDLTGALLQPHFAYLPLDTCHFPDLELDLLALFEDLDESLDGWLVHSENYQALNTLLPKFRNRIQVIYIDPPYNTDASSIIYMNNYKNSSWITMMDNRLSLANQFMDKFAIISTAIDDEELRALIYLLQDIFPKQVGVACVRSNPAGRKTKGKFAPAHEYSIFYGKSESSIPSSLEKTEKSLGRYPKEDDQGRFAWANFIRSGSNDKREDRPKLYYPIVVDKFDNIRIPDLKWSEKRREYEVLEIIGEEETIVYPIVVKDGIEIQKNWQRGHIRVSKELPFGEYRVRRSIENSISIDFKTRMDDESLPITWWDNKKYASANYGAAELKELFSDRNFDFPKSLSLVNDCLLVSGAKDEYSIILDFFAGSGTTAHAVMNLNREDGGNRKYILVEMGEHFHTVILPRIKKIAFHSKWKDGKPHFTKGESGMSHFVKYFDLEQYEETLQRARYRDADLFDDPNQDPYHAYVFLRDLKLLDSLDLDLEKDMVHFHPERLYSDPASLTKTSIDLAESLSHLKGKWIKRIRPDEVEFQDGEVVNLRDPDWRLFKPMIWW